LLFNEFVILRSSGVEIEHYPCWSIVAGCTLLTSNRPEEDWGKLLGDSAAVTAMLDRLLHHGHILKCGPRSWRTKTDLPDQEKAG
jgi:IstB-like ATP binding protein